jgi:hypothetical protein
MFKQSVGYNGLPIKAARCWRVGPLEIMLGPAYYSDLSRIRYWQLDFRWRVS